MLGELRLVPDQDHFSVPGGQLEGVEIGATQRGGLLRLDPQGLAGERCGVRCPHLWARKAGVDLDPENGKAGPRRLCLSLALGGESTCGVICIAALGIAVTK